MQINKLMFSLLIIVSIRLQQKNKIRIRCPCQMLIWLVLLCKRNFFPKLDEQECWGSSQVMCTYPNFIKNNSIKSYIILLSIKQNKSSITLTHRRKKTLFWINCKCKWHNISENTIHAWSKRSFI